jgi:chromatin remodeling complex protein RSC6
MSSSKSNVNSNKMPADKKTPVKKAAAAKAEVVVPVVETPAPTPVAAPAPTPVATPAPVATTSTDAVLSAIQAELKSLSGDVSTRVRALLLQVTEATRALKREARDSKRRRKIDPADMTPEQKATWEARRANNAFLKLRPISDELASFMGLPAKSQRSQTDVTKFVSTYVKEHACFDPSFKRRIVPDAKLAKLLRAKDGQEVTYLNLQSFLKVHFLKPETA